MKSLQPTTVLKSIALAAAAAVLGMADGAPKKISTSEAMNALVTRVNPAYPDLAKQLRISGAVELDVTIAESGAVEAVAPLSGNPVLTKPASDAVKKWKFKPFLQDGVPVRAQVAVKITFN